MGGSSHERLDLVRRWSGNSRDLSVGWLLVCRLARDGGHQRASLGNGSGKEMSMVHTGGPCHIATTEGGLSMADAQVTSLVPMLSTIQAGLVSAKRFRAEPVIATLKPLRLGIKTSSG